MKSIRWKQRFENLTRSFGLFKRICAIENPSEAELMGLIQSFEIVFELSWKTVKDYLEAEGYQVASPREVIKQAFQNEILEDGSLWLEALTSRNQMAHLYDEKIAERVTTQIKEQYLPMIKQLHEFLSAQND